VAVPFCRARGEEPGADRVTGGSYRPDAEFPPHTPGNQGRRQADAWVWVDETTAVTPLGPEPHDGAVPETWPFGL